MTTPAPAPDDSSATTAVRVVVVAGVWPYACPDIEAASVVSYEIVAHLAATPGFSVGFARIAADDEPPPPRAAEALRALSALGVTLFDGIRIAPAPARSRVRRAFSRYVAASPRHLLPGGANSDDLRAICEHWNADCALTVWCGSGTAALYSVPVGRMAYYGNPDHKVARAIADFDWRYRQHTVDLERIIARIKAIVGVSAIKRAHLKVMRSFDAIGDVAANDAAYYQRHGARAFYLRDMWPRAAAIDWERARDATEQETPLKIVGNVGSLSGTGNTRALHTLATSVLPALKRTLGEGNFEVHLFGVRHPHPYLTGMLDDPHIRIRGYVDGLDAEMLSAPVFLVANNHSEFKVGQTGLLHAWSLGACVVAFRGSAEAVPELVHRRNALLASTPDDMAALVAETARDKSLRRSLGHAGAATVESQFDPAAVTSEIADRLRAITAGRAAGLSKV